VSYTEWNWLVPGERGDPANSPLCVRRGLLLCVCVCVCVYLSHHRQPHGRERLVATIAFAVAFLKRLWPGGDGDVGGALERVFFSECW